MEFKGKKIGIWGYGITGKSTANFMIAHGAHLSIMDKNSLASEQSYFESNNITLFNQNELEQFFELNELIIPSAGIDLRPYYEKYKSKWLFELDIFAQEFKKPYIAITGSVGKTTITSLLSQLLAMYGKKVATGGNIGIASLDLIAHQDDVEFALLEVSSFQLEHATQFAPYIAVITTILENHLDRHGTMEEYVRAKCNIFAHQNKNNPRSESFASSGRTGGNQRALLPKSVRPELAKGIERIPTEKIPLLDALPPLTFDQNWLIIIAILEALELPISELPTHAKHLKMPEHRLEYVTTIHGTRYYNDSKSTTPSATQAAVEKFSTIPIHLLLGGLSKGINREPLIANLKGNVKTIYCFGKEAETLKNMCTLHHIPACAYASLEEAVSAAHKTAKQDEIILLSPAGSSYDLFENFEHRGRIFKELVQALSDK